MLEWWWTWQFPIFPGQNHLHSKLMVVMLKERQRISDKGNVLWTKTKITIQETEPNSCQKWVTYLNLNTGIMPHLVNNTQTLYQSHHVSHLDPPKPYLNIHLTSALPLLCSLPRMVHRGLVVQCTCHPTVRGRLLSSWCGGSFLGLWYRFVYLNSPWN